MKIVEFVGTEELDGLVAGLASRIAEDYRDKNPVLVGVLKGAFIFMADLVRRLDIPVEVDFVRAASYGDSMNSSGSVVITKAPEIELCGRDVIVVEDIVDTGRSLNYILEHIKGCSPASVRVCALLDKPSGREFACEMDYVGMEVGGSFVVGYGLDYAERYRNLPGLYAAEEENVREPARN